MSETANDRRGRTGVARTVLLGLGLAVALAVFTLVLVQVPPACFIGSRPPAPPEPWYALFVARLVIVIGPAGFLIAGAFVALGARRVVWRIAGLVLAVLAAAAAFVVVLVAMNGCA